MEQSREERVKRPLGVSLRRKSVPFHKAEKMDEEAVSPSISSDWYSCFSQTRAFQVCLTHGSHDFSWHTLLSLTIFPNYLQGNSFHQLPMSRCGWGLCPPYLSSPFGQLCFTDAARSFHLWPSLSFQQLEMLPSTMSLLPGKKKKKEKVKTNNQKEKHMPLVSAEECESFLVLVLPHPHGALSWSLALLWMLSPSLFPQMWAKL